MLTAFGDNTPQYNTIIGPQPGITIKGNNRDRTRRLLEAILTALKRRRVPLIIDTLI